MSDELAPRNPTTLDQLYADQLAWLTAVQDRRAVARSRRLRALGLTVGAASTVLAVAALTLAQLGLTAGALVCAVVAVAPCAAAAVYIAVTWKPPGGVEPDEPYEDGWILPADPGGRQTFGPRPRWGAAWTDQAQIRAAERGLPAVPPRRAIAPPRSDG